MNTIKLLFALSISLSFGSILADDFDCRELTGDIRLYPSSDGRCHILKKKAKRFSDSMFLSELGFSQTCFIGKVTGTLGDEPIAGMVFSGLTANNLNGSFITAASFIKIRNAHDGTKLGNIFTYDSIFDPEGDTRERLAVIAGTNRFEGGTGHIEILGNVFGGALLSGTLCLQE